MELPGLELSGPATSTPYAEVRTGRRLADGAAVRVERLRATDADVRERLLASADPLRRADGRHLVRVRDVVVADGLAVVRDDVPGEPVAGPLPVARAVGVVADVLDALAALHALGLVHGALDRRDVLLDASVPLRTTVRLTGWGIAGVLSPVPPAPAEDVAAAGRLLVELAGEGLPPSAAEVVDRMRAADPAQRPSAGEARDALRRLSGLPVAAEAPQSTSPPQDRHVRREPAPAGGRPLRVAAAVVVAAAVLGLGVLGGRLLASGDDTDDTTTPQPAAAAEPAGPYVFPALQRPDGLVLERSWVLEQGGAVLRGTTVVRNPTLEPRNAGVDEVVPKSVADDVDDLEFTPGPDAIVERDPVVRFNVRALPAGGSTTWTFVVRLPEPVEQSALARLAADAEAARVDYEQRRQRLLEQLRSSAAPGAPGPSPTS